MTTSARNITYDASDNTHTKSQNENGYHDKSATAATTQQNVSLGVQNSASFITVDSLNNTPNNSQMVNITIILTFLWNEIQYFNTLFFLLYLADSLIFLVKYVQIISLQFMHIISFNSLT